MNLRMTQHFSSGVDVMVLGCVVGNSIDWASVNARIHLSSGLHSTVLNCRISHNSESHRSTPEAHIVNIVLSFSKTPLCVSCGIFCSCSCSCIKRKLLEKKG